MKNTALITGGDSGIGLALAHEFARHGHDLILVARNPSELDKASRALALNNAGCEVHTIARDLEDEDTPQEIHRELMAGGIEVDILVNNAGHGARGKFHELPLERHLSVIELNINALVRMTRLFLPDLVARNSGRILNLASVASFQPGPLLATYHATKAFVLSLTIAIREELRDTNITVTALAPGATDTRFFERADMQDTRIAQNDNMLMDPGDVARGAYKALMAGEDIFIPGPMNKVMTAMRHVMPKTLQALFNEKLYEETRK